MSQFVFVDGQPFDRESAIEECVGAALVQLSHTKGGRFVPQMNVRRIKILRQAQEIANNLVRNTTGGLLDFDDLVEFSDALYRMRDRKEVDNSGWGQYSLRGQRSCNHKRRVKDPRDKNRVLRIPQWLKGTVGR